MAANAKLVELDLSDNAFGPNGMNGLIDLLTNSSCYSLRELRLNNNGLGITGGKVSMISCSAVNNLKVFFERIPLTEMHASEIIPLHLYKDTCMCHSFY